MKWFEELERIEIKNPERFAERFKMLFFNVRNNPEAYKEFKHDVNIGDGIITKVKDTVYIVPSEVKDIFNKIKKNINEPEGFSVLASSEYGIRVCCFGVKYNLLGKALI